jgi:HEAT repeat protein
VFAYLIAGLLALQTPSATTAIQTPAPAAADTVTATLISLYDGTTDDADTKETIIRHLSERGDAAAMAKIASIAKSDPDIDMRETAIRQIAAHARDSGALIQLYDEQRETELKEAVLRHLGERGDDKATAKLIAIAKSDVDDDLRETAVRRLASVSGEARTTLLIEIYHASTSTDLKEAIIRQLSDRGDAKASAKLLAIAKGDADSELRQAAIRSIAAR